ncbi:MAG: hypothetical protein ACREVM_06455, partial [Burkholderiales bacterium]
RQPRCEHALAAGLNFILVCKASSHPTLVEWLDWRRAKGGLKTRECRDRLQQLQEPALLELPALRAGRPRGYGDPRHPARRRPSTATLRTRLGAAGPAQTN